MWAASRAHEWGWFDRWVTAEIRKAPQGSDFFGEVLAIRTTGLWMLLLITATCGLYDRAAAAVWFRRSGWLWEVKPGGEVASPLASISPFSNIQTWLRLRTAIRLATREPHPDALGSNIWYSCRIVFLHYTLVPLGPLLCSLYMPKRYYALGKALSF